MSKFRRRNFGAKKKWPKAALILEILKITAHEFRRASSQRFPVKHADFEAMSGVLKLLNGIEAPSVVVDRRQRLAEVVEHRGGDDAARVDDGVLVTVRVTVIARDQGGGTGGRRSGPSRRLRRPREGLAAVGAEIRRVRSTGRRRYTYMATSDTRALTPLVGVPSGPVPQALGSRCRVVCKWGCRRHRTWSPPVAARCPG